MKKLFQIILVYGLGILFVMTFIWRADCLNRNTNHNKLASNEHKYYTYNK